MVHGIVLAFGLILPLGAQNVFVFNQGASHSLFKRSIPVILTASLCDTFLILLAVLGVSVIVLSIPFFHTFLLAIGVIFLLYIGWTVWSTKPSDQTGSWEGVSAKKQIVFALSVSLLNPHAILDTIGVIGTSSLTYSGLDKVVFTLACIIVSWVWFFGLAVAGRIVGQLDTAGKVQVRINKLSAIIIWAVAIYLVLELIKLN